jgi:hypothetical protein
MRIVALYHPKSDHEGRVLDFRADFQRIKGKDIELMSLETTQGAETAKLYDITIYPAILAMTNDGLLLKAWQGNDLPMMNELEYYTTQ